MLVPFRPIQQHKVYTHAVNQIRELIRAGVLKPGQKLPTEKELANQLGISRPSFREALRILEAIGMVQTLKGVGTFIAQQASSGAVDDLVSELFTLGDPFDLIETRDIVESGIAALVAMRASPGDIDQLEAMVSTVEAASHPPEHHPMEPDLEFHYALARLTRNPILMELMQIIADRLKQRVWQTVRPQLINGLAESGILGRHHRKILDAIKAGDPERARAAMHSHMAELRASLDGHPGGEE